MTKAEIYREDKGIFSSEEMDLTDVDLTSSVFSSEEMDLTDVDLTSSSNEENELDQEEDRTPFISCESNMFVFQKSRDSLLHNYVDFMTEQHMSLRPLLTARQKHALLRASPLSPEYWKELEKKQAATRKPTQGKKGSRESLDLSLRINGQGRMARRLARKFNPNAMRQVVQGLKLVGAQAA